MISLQQCRTYDARLYGCTGFLFIGGSNPPADGSKKLSRLCRGVVSLAACASFELKGWVSLLRILRDSCFALGSAFKAGVIGAASAYLSCLFFKHSCLLLKLRSLLMPVATATPASECMGMDKWNVGCVGLLLRKIRILKQSIP